MHPGFHHSEILRQLLQEFESEVRVLSHQVEDGRPRNEANFDRFGRNRGTQIGLITEESPIAHHRARPVNLCDLGLSLIVLDLEFYSTGHDAEDA